MQLLAIFLTSLNNWAVPVAIYWQKYGLFKERPENFVGVNIWGVVMDVFLASLINITILNFVSNYKDYVNVSNILVALSWGLAFTAAVHIFMATSYWRVWIMPLPWRWNLAGYWHMVSMTLQMSFAFFPLVILAQSPNLLFLPATQDALIKVAGLGVLFLISLYFEKSARPW